MDRFLECHGVEVRERKAGGNWAFKWSLAACPFCGEEDKSAVIVLTHDGRYGYTCRHNRCNGKGLPASAWCARRRDPGGAVVGPLF